MSLRDHFPKEWKDFPKGLQVMVVDKDEQVLADVKCKLEGCGYAVTTFSNGQAALEALQDERRLFHVAVVEATTSDALDGFEIVAAARHMTTIMMADTQNMGIMMQGIAAGASEFLQKPLSEEKLKNVWQHVVRKALSTGHITTPSDALPSKEDSAMKSSFLKAKLEPITDVKIKKEPPFEGGLQEDTDIFFNHSCMVEEEPGYFSEGKPELEDCDGFLCSYTPPQLEQPSSRVPAEDQDTTATDVESSVLQDFTSLKQEMEDTVDDKFDECEEYLQIKSEVEDAVNNSTILNELFDSNINEGDNSQNHHHLFSSNGDEFEQFDSSLGSDLQFGEEMQDSFDGMRDVVAGDVLSLGEEYSFFGQDSLRDEDLSLGSLDCLDDEDMQGSDEEALLLAEVAKAEKGETALCSSSRLLTQDHQHQIPSPTKNCDKFINDYDETNNPRSDSEQSSSKGSKTAIGKKKLKVDWTPELHRRFVQAVEQLGVDKAIPSKILELMGVKCLTRHNIASHLQKYRSHRKHLLAREAGAATWNQRRHMAETAGAVAASCTTNPPLPPSPAWAVSHTPPQIRRPSPASLPMGPALHVWGRPPAASLEHVPAPMHFWPAWPAPVCQVDAWGHPVMPASGMPFYSSGQPVPRLPLVPVPSIANMAPAPHSYQHRENTCSVMASKLTSHPPKETVDAAINEVLRNPFIPLPLGLKPPSSESVISELQRQGIAMATS